jgi:hypothetical protein
MGIGSLLSMSRRVCVLGSIAASAGIALISSKQLQLNTLTSGAFSESF